MWYGMYELLGAQNGVFFSLVYKKGMGESKGEAPLLIRRSLSVEASWVRVELPPSVTEWSLVNSHKHISRSRRRGFFSVLESRVSFPRRRSKCRSGFSLDAFFMLLYMPQCELKCFCLYTYCRPETNCFASAMSKIHGWSRGPGARNEHEPK